MAVQNLWFSLCTPSFQQKQLALDFLLELCGVGYKLYTSLLDGSVDPVVLE